MEIIKKLEHSTLTENEDKTEDTNIENITYGNIIVTKNGRLVTAGTSAEVRPTGVGPVDVFASQTYDTQEQADKIFNTCVNIIKTTKASDGTGMASYYNYKNHHKLVKAKLSSVIDRRHLYAGPPAF